MGDKSPKSTNKLASQKKSKNNADAATKKAAVLGKQTAGKAKK